MRALIGNIIASLERGHRFVTHDVWRIGRPGEEVPHGIIIKNIRVFILLFRGVMAETLLLRASALTFATLLFIVPFLTFMFFFITTFNLGEGVYNQLADRFDSWVTEAVSLPWDFGVQPHTIAPEEAQEFLGDRQSESLAPLAAWGSDWPAGNRLPVGTASGLVLRMKPSDYYAAHTPTESALAPDERLNQELKEQILEFVLQGVGQPEGEDSPYRNPVQMLVSMAEGASRDLPTLGISGIIFILATVFGMMRNVETSFNAIWGVARNRNYFRVLSDYLMITLLLPFVAAAVLGITAALESDAILTRFGPLAQASLRATQFGVICAFMALINWMVPNTRVQFRYAVIGGIVGGCLWVLNAYIYVKFQIGLARNTLFFSGFALFPLLIMWIYVSWVILLFGALLTYACQNEKTFALEQHADTATFAYREAIAVRLIVELARRFRDGRPGLAVSEAADAWNVPQRLINDTLEPYIAAGLVSRVATEPPRYQPARSPDRITLRDVVKVVREAGEDPSLLRQDRVYGPVYEALADGDEQFLRSSVTELLGQTEPVRIENVTTVQSQSRDRE
jgi:YihY family inner membrane protein